MKPTWPVLAIAAAVLWLAGCAAAAQDLRFDPNPNVLLIEAQNTGPLMPPAAQCFLLPDLRIWGDGRVARVMSKGNVREVSVGHLSADRIQQLLIFLQQQGALSPSPRSYSAPNPSGARFVFKVQLNTGPIEQSTFPPPAFFQKLLEFLNPDVKPLVPTRAFLIATRGEGRPDKARDFPPSFNVSLAQAMDQGIWIGGDALNFLWEDANNNRSLHVFRQNGKSYSIALELPGIGPKEPPENCWAEWNRSLPKETP